MTLKLFFKCKSQLHTITSFLVTLTTKTLTKDDYFASSLLFIFNWKLSSLIKTPRMTKNGLSHFAVFITFTFISPYCNVRLEKCSSRALFQGKLFLSLKTNVKTI